MTLAACAHGPASPPDLKAGPAPDPIVESKTVTRLVCPSALSRETGPTPQVPDGAVIRHNDAGGDYLDAVVGRLGWLEQMIADARAECLEKGAALP